VLFDRVRMLKIVQKIHENVIQMIVNIALWQEKSIRFFSFLEKFCEKTECDDDVIKII